MKKIWMKVGMDVDVTDEEYSELMDAAANEDYPNLEKIFRKMIERGVPSGESYILGKDDVWGLEDYDNPPAEISIDI